MSDGLLQHLNSSVVTDLHTGWHHFLFNDSRLPQYNARNAVNTTQRTVIVTAYLVAFMAGVLGNGLVLYVLLRFVHIRVKSVANYYIGNLAVADFCFIATLPLFCWATYSADWPFGDTICKLATVFHNANRFVGIFTLVALSVDRYVASHYDLGRWRTVRVGKLACGVVWVCATALTTPYLLYSRTVVADSQSNGSSTSCRLIWPNSGAGHYSPIHKSWSRALFGVGFVLPFLVIVAAYAALGVRLRRLLAAGSKAAIKRPGRAMTRTTIVITATFILTQLPVHIVAMMSAAKGEQLAAMRLAHSEAMAVERASNVTRPDVVMSAAAVSDTELLVYVWLNTVAKLLAFMSSCCNPVIYGLFNHNYRMLYSEALVGHCYCVRRPQLVRTATTDATAGAATRTDGGGGGAGGGCLDADAASTSSRRRLQLGRGGSSRRSGRRLEVNRRTDEDQLTESVELTKVDVANGTASATDTMPDGAV